jgi:hypothetical protein
VITNEWLSAMCALGYAGSGTNCITLESEKVYLLTRELIELRALRDGKPAFTPSVIGEAVQAGAVTNDTENQRSASIYDLVDTSKV